VKMSMKTRYHGALLLLAFCLLAASPLQAALSEKTVVVTGKAAGTDEDAKDEALRDAQRNAVEQIAVKIYSETRTDMFATVLDRVIARAQGYVKNSRIIRKDVKDGMTILRVRVTVATQSVVDDWGAIQAALKGAGKPRTMVVVSELIDEVVETKRSNISNAENAVIRYLNKKGFPLVDKAQMKAVEATEMKAARAAGDVPRMARIGSQYKAEIIIVGQAEATYGGTITMMGTTMYQYKAQLDLKAIRTDTAQVLAASTSTGKAAGMNRGDAAKKAIKEASKGASKRFLDDILKRWRDEFFGGAAVTVIINGAEFKDIDKIMKAIKTRRHVSGAVVRTIRPGSANVEVTTTLDARRLAESLEKLPGIKLKVEEMTAKRIVTRYVSSPGPSVAPEGED